MVFEREIVEQSDETQNSKTNRPSDAYCKLMYANLADASETVPLIETVLFGEPQPTECSNDAECVALGLPTQHELIHSFDLDSAKALCRYHRARSNGVPERAPNGGRFVVIDFLGNGCAAARDASATMTAAGLTPHSHFSNTQHDDACCGHLAAGWAVKLRELGANFASITSNAVAEENTQVSIDLKKQILQHPETQWLREEEIQQIATQLNPDGPGLSPSWLSGPGPINSWHVHFARTLASQPLHGRVHIMVVNSEAAYTLTDGGAGQHWFAVAWLVEPSPPAANQ